MFVLLISFELFVGVFVVALGRLTVTACICDWFAGLVLCVLDFFGFIVT